MRAAGMVALTVAAIVAAFAVACASSEDTTDSGATPGTVHTDLAPLVATCPGLDHATAAHWQAWSPDGPGFAPGPTDTIIEALVSLPPNDIASLRADYTWTPDASPAATNLLRPHLPQGGAWLHGRNVGLCRAFFGAVYLHPDSGVVYLNVSTM